MINKIQLVQIIKGKKYFVLMVFCLSFCFYFMTRRLENSLLQSVLRINYSLTDDTGQNHSITAKSSKYFKTLQSTTTSTRILTSKVTLAGPTCPTINSSGYDHLTIQPNMIPPNHKLFVVGDVHGCLDELLQLLKISNVSCRTHFIVFCGDLINKGPKSLETLRYIQSNKNCMFSVQGNHEQELNKHLNESLSYEPNIKSIEEFSETSTKSKWATTMTAEDICFLIRLPYTISIPSFNVIVVHAGLKPEVPIHNQSRTTMLFATTLETASTTPVLKNKTVIALNKSGLQTWASLWDGPQLVIFGHDSARGFQRHRHAIGLDTGCVYGKNLTGVEITKGPNESFHQRFTSVMSFDDYVKIKL